MPFRVGHSLQLFFADHMLDNDRHELRRGSETVVVEPQVFDLLLYLCRTVIAARAQPNIFTRVDRKPDFDQAGRLRGHYLEAFRRGGLD